jgi:hypothetical protein
MLFRLGLLADSLETSCNWEKCEDCIKKVEKVYNQHLMKLKVQGFIAFRYIKFVGHATLIST